MAFNLPAFALDASVTDTGIRLPVLVLNASVVDTGIKLPKYVLDASPVNSGLMLPKFGLTEATAQTFTHNGNLALQASLAADIVGDPFIAKLSTQVGLASDMSFVQLTKYEHYGQLAVKTALAATIADKIVGHNGNLAIEADLSATVDSYHAPQIFEETTLANTANVTSDAIASQVFTNVAETSTANVTSGATGGLTFTDTTLTSTVDVTSTATANKVINEVASSTISVSSNATSSGIFYERLPASIANVIAGAVYIREFMDGWAFCLNNQAPSSYENFSFNSFAKIGENYYGLNSAGLHLLGGDTDNGADINAVITTGRSDFDDPRTKKLALLYAGARTEDTMLLTARVDNNDEYTYEFTSDSENVAPTRVKLGRGLAGRYWSFELSNQNGADFEIDALDIPLQPNTRRI